MTFGSANVLGAETAPNTNCQPRVQLLKKIEDPATDLEEGRDAVHMIGQALLKSPLSRHITRMYETAVEQGLPLHAHGHLQHHQPLREEAP
eukprot:CAMPEP_0118968640 /NCGR_PEP_ID=MMETSP1173-20130426/5855_1 /TAXON_ID=1034831 /ORGANISM="Rhizochromulina marina cf, Strain CCMP1243" /LENGTH=90 /DNA_ID=CAMNT_0006917783 /DNA_START=117 /DNA_END=385 /DNA_ORIENTATION=+